MQDEDTRRLGPATSKVVPGGYELGQRLHAGDDATIYQAKHPRIPGAFAVKLLDRKLVADPRAVAAFRAEAELTASLRHPNIVQIFDINTLPDGRPFVVMEYLDGVDLEQRLAGNVALPFPQTVAIIEGIAAGLAAAHARGVIHRDLRPANVFLVRMVGHDERFVKILNFGMSNLRTSAQVGGGNVHFIAEPHTMAPEQALGDLASIDARTDQFALAAIAFRMLTGVQAFRGEDPLAVLAQIAHHPPRSLGLRSTCPPGIEPVLLRGLAKDKVGRFASVLDFAQAFKEAALAPRADFSVTDPLGGMPIPASVSAPPRPFSGGAFSDEILEVDESVFHPRARGRALLLFLLLLAAGAGTVFLAGDQLPSAWRRTGLWHTLRLPHALPADGSASALAIAPGDETTPGASLPANVQGGAAETVADGGAIAAAAAPAAPDAGLAVPAIPDAAVPENPAAIVVADEEPAPPPDPPAARPRRAVKRSRSSRPIPMRGYVWSEEQQRLVPAGGAGATP